MNLVFVNSFEKRVEENRHLSAQVSITEQQGNWLVTWEETNEEGNHVQEIWYEGGKWQEMLAGFRIKLAEKASNGFLPLIDGDWDDSEASSSRSVFNRMLHYYSEVHGHEELFQRLREWRKEQAAQLNKPSYLIATNRVLQMIACYMPQTAQELAQIPGFGEQKCGLYGNGILEITGKYTRTSEFPLDWVAGQVDLYDFKLWQHQQKESKLKAILEKKAVKRKLLELIAAGNNLTTIVKQLKLQRRDVVLWIEELEAEGYEFDAWIEAELGGMPEDDRARARQAMEKQGIRYLKPVLQQMYTAEELGQQNIDQLYEWLRFMRLQFKKKQSTDVKAG